MDAVTIVVFVLCLFSLLYQFERETPDYRSAAYKRQFSSARRYVLRRDGYRCRSCGATTNLHVHHIVPRARGGTNNQSNLIVLCHHCHGRMHGQRWY